MTVGSGGEDGWGYERNVGEHRTERVSEPWNRNMICKRVSERKRLYERERERDKT